MQTIPPQRKGSIAKRLTLLNVKSSTDFKHKEKIYRNSNEVSLKKKKITP